VSDNVLVDTIFGDTAAVDRAFAGVDHVVAVDLHIGIGRVTGVPIDPRAALGQYDAGTDRYTPYAGSGGPVLQKTELAAVLGVAPDRVRVLSYDVGGNFGVRNRVYVEFGLVLWAARKLGRPVKYTATRLEAFLSDFQGRDLVTRVALALRSDGRFLGVAGRQCQQCRRTLCFVVAARQGVGAGHRFLRHPGGESALARGVH